MEKTNSYGKKLISGALLLTLSGIIVKVLGLIYKIPLSYILSDEGMSYFNSAYTVYTFFYIICTSGIPKAISILISEAEGEGNVRRVKSIYRTSVCVFGVLGLIISVLFLALAVPISKATGNSSSAPTMIAIAPSVMFTCIAGVIRGYFSGKMNFVPIAVSEAVAGVARLVLGLVLALFANYMGYDLTLVSAFTILGTTLGSFVGFIYLAFYRKKENIRINLRQKYLKIEFNLSITKQILRIAIPITLTSAIGSISSIIDLSIIMNGLKSAGYSELQAGIMYGNYTTLVIPMLNLLGALIAPLSMVLLPVVSKGEIKNDSNLLSERISYTIKILCFISVPSTVVFLLRSKEVLSILFEDSSAAVAAPLLSVLAPGIIFMCFLTVINTSLEGIGNTKVPLLSLIVGSIVKLIVTYFLIRNDSFGIFGAPIGTALSYVVSFIISAYYFTLRKKIKVKFMSALLPVTAASLVSITICGALRRLVNSINIYVYLGELAVFALIYCFIIFCFNIKSVVNKNKMAKYTKNKYFNYI